MSRREEQTKAELERSIRLMTKELNEALKNMDDITPATQTAISKLKTYGGKGRSKNSIGLHLQGKTKEELIRQKRELEYVRNLGIDTEVGQTYLNEKFQKSYNTLRETFEDLTEEEHRQIVESFGAVGENIVQQYDSNTIVDMLAGKGKNVNLTRLMLDTVRENRGAGLTQEELTEILMDKIREEIG